MSTLVEKWDGKFVVRRSLESAWVEEMEAVPLIDGILVAFCWTDVGVGCECECDVIFIRLLSLSHLSELIS